MKNCRIKFSRKNYCMQHFLQPNFTQHNTTNITLINNIPEEINLFLPIAIWAILWYNKIRIKCVSNWGWPKMANKTRHHFLTIVEHPESQQVKSGRRVIPSPEKIREEAMLSKSGGRAYCDYCKTWFSASYVRPVRILFNEKFACRDCIKEHSLIIAK